MLVGRVGWLIGVEMGGCKLVRQAGEFSVLELMNRRRCIHCGLGAAHQYFYAMHWVYSHLPAEEMSARLLRSRNNSKLRNFTLPLVTFFRTSFVLADKRPLLSHLTLLSQGR